MYEQVFQFNSRPFTATPYVKHYFAGDAIHSALGQARSCIDRASGPVVVVGPTGTGKSLLLAVLEEQYKSQFNAVNLACGRLDSRRELLQSILFELQLPFKAEQESDLRFELMDFLSPSERCPNGVLLLVDEAHMLSTDLLDELRLIMNFVRDGQPRVRMVMAGNQRLEENLTDPKLESFNQRIAARCYLQNMSRDETASYVKEHIDRVGGNGAELFDEQSLKTIHEVSDGCPRLINQVSDQALILIATQGHAVVTSDCVQDAWSDVQCIPGARKMNSPQNAPEPMAALNSDEKWTVIEFGSLDDEGEDSESAHAVSEEMTNDQEDSSEVETSFEHETSSEDQTDSEDEVAESEVSESWNTQDDENELVSEIADQSNESVVSQLCDLKEDGERCEETTHGDEAEPQLHEPALESDDDQEEETFVGWGSEAADEPTMDEKLNLVESSEAVAEPEMSEPDDSREANDSELESVETTNDMAAELAAVFGDQYVDPISDPEATSSTSIEELELEQEQIVEQVEQEQQNVFGTIGTVENELEGSVFGVMEEDENSATDSDEALSIASEDGPDNESWNTEQIDEETASADDLTSTTMASDEDDSQESLQQNAPQLRQPVETVDPFAESFEEEEDLLDRYAPFVAHQNLSSLSITSEHLSMLTPNDELEDQPESESSISADSLTTEATNEEGESTLENAQDDSPEENLIHFEHETSNESDEVDEVDDELENEMSAEVPVEVMSSVDDVCNEVEEEDHQQNDSSELVDESETLHESEPQGQLEDDEQPTFESETDSESETESAEAGSPQVHEHVSEATSSDIQKQAEEILKRLNISKDVSHETPGHDQPTSVPEESLQSNADVTTESTEFERQSAALDESQQILNEILEQKNALAKQRDSFNQPQPSSIKIDQPTNTEESNATGSTPIDDREMIIVNRMEQPAEAEKPAETPVPFPSTPVSTGRAERMDYQKLFDQLRDISTSQES